MSGLESCVEVFGFYHASYGQPLGALGSRQGRIMDVGSLIHSTNIKKKNNLYVTFNFDIISN